MQIQFDPFYSARMPLAKMTDKSFNPIEVDLFGTDAVVFQPDFSPHLVK